MNLSETISQHIAEAFTKGNWSDVSLADTLEDVTLQEAISRTPATVNTIASLVYHMTFYNDIIMERLKGNAPFISDANGYDMPPLQTEAEWQQLKERCLQTANNLAEAARQVPEEKLFEPILPNASTVYKTLHGIAEHTHYHLGQIVLLKKYIRNTAGNPKMSL